MCGVCVGPSACLHVCVLERDTGERGKRGVENAESHKQGQGTQAP